MKRLIVLFVLLFSVVYANPVIPPDLYLSEIIIDSTNNWQIELFNPNYDDPDWYWFHDHALKTNSSYTEIIEFDSTSEFILITNDNLNQSLTINSSRDSIKFLSIGSSPYLDYVVIGDQEGATIKSLDSSQSISRYSPNTDYLTWGLPIYYKDNTPTPGTMNDLDSGSGNIEGHVYDYSGQPLMNKYFFIDEGASGQILIDQTGHYSADILSRSYIIDQIRIYVTSSDCEEMDFTPVTFDLETDDNLQIDLYQMQTSIRPVIQNTIKFNNYPHPASSYTWFFIDNTDIEASAMRVNVYALNGRKVDSFKPRAYQYRYDCSHLPQGSYIMSLQHGREVLATKKLQILK